MLKFHRCGAYTSVYKTNGIMFKEFGNKDDASYAYMMQRDLAEYNLAPKVHSRVRRIRVEDVVNDNQYTISGYGYYTEIAKLLTTHDPLCECSLCENIWNCERVYKEVEELCDNIKNVTGEFFVDCHIGNVGYIVRNGVKLLVCIDTGHQSFCTHSVLYHSGVGEYA